MGIKLMVVIAELEAAIGERGKLDVFLEGKSSDYHVRICNGE
jgi:hypothetical protein